MSDDFNDDDDLGVDESSFDEFGEEKQTLATIFRDNPLAKVGVIAGAIILVFGAIVLFGGRDAELGQSLVGTSSDVSSPPATAGASQEYIEAIKEVNEREVEIAQQTGGSALPTPIEPPIGTLTVPEEEAEAEDPLARWRRLQEERLQRELQQAQTVEPAVVQEDTGRGAAVQALADLMAQQMQAILDSQENRVSQLSLSTEDALEAELAENEDLLDEEVVDDGDIIQNVLLPASEIAFAQLLTQANSDVPGPILAQILSGPLKGARVLGEFQVQKKYLTLTFNTLVLDDQTIPINAVALDPETTLPGMATHVNHRFFKRVILPAAAAFVEGAAEAISESGRTTITVDGDTVTSSTDDADEEQEIASGIEEAGEELGDILDDIADDTEILIKVAKGTPLGLLFIESVLEPVQ